MRPHLLSLLSDVWTLAGVIVTNGRLRHSRNEAAQSDLSGSRRKCGNATDELLHWQLRSPCHGLHMSVQDEEEEAEPEQPAKKPVKEEAVFAGNKNLRSEDQKYREINDDRQVIPTHMPELCLPDAPPLLHVWRLRARTSQQALRH